MNQYARITELEDTLQKVLELFEPRNQGPIVLGYTIDVLGDDDEEMVGIVPDLAREILDDAEKVLWGDTELEDIDD